ncbi:MAG: LPS export ABC transporter periplasmic protein LptC [Oscillatoriales cyanobacterium]|nr:MAG: LPS export ABC transporter periplasmic protein LptC [Oscillatoriales cyanobacterium]
MRLVTAGGAGPNHLLSAKVGLCEMGARTRAISVLMATLLAGLGAGCGGTKSRGEEKIARDTKAAEEFQGDLVFDNLTLNRADKKGQVLWEVRAKEGRYSRDRQLARLSDVKGKLFQDGKVIYEIAAQRGEVEQNGQVLKVSGKLRAKDLRDKMEFQGGEAIWEPTKFQLQMKGGVVLTHPQAIVRSEEAVAFSRDRRVELAKTVKLVSKDKQTKLDSDRLIWQMKADELQAIGKVVATGSKPALKLTGDRLVWQRKKQITEAIGNVVAVDDKGANRLSADRIVWQMKDQIAEAQGRAVAVGQKPAMQLNADRIVWQMKDQIAEAQGRAVAVGQKPAMQLNADRIVWQLKDRVAQAIGNVVAVGQDPAVRVQSQRVVWQQTPQLVSSDTRTIIERFACAGGQCRISDRATGGLVDVSLKDRVAFLRNQAQVSTGNPGVDVAGDSLIWQFQAQQLTADRPVTVYERQQQIVLNADRGAMNLKDQVADMIGNVRSVSRLQGSTLNTDRLVWSMANQYLQAFGNVFYQQANPFLISRGNYAAGSVKDGAIFLQSGAGARARSTFFPESLRAAASPAPAPPGPAPVAPGPAPAPAAPPQAPSTLPPIPTSLLTGSDAGNFSDPFLNLFGP